MPAKGKGKAVAHDEQPMEVDNGEGMSAGALIKKHQAKMAWLMAGWHGGAALYHPQGCQKCDDYVAHTVEASDLNQLNVLRKDIEQALKVAWPSIIRDIEDDAISGIHEDLDNLQYNFDQLLLQLDEARQELDREKGRSAHLKSELKRYQSVSSDTHPPSSSEQTSAHYHSPHSVVITHDTGTTPSSVIPHDARTPPGSVIITDDA